MSSSPDTIPGTIYRYAVLIDTGPLYALRDSTDGRHNEAIGCLREISHHQFPLYVSNLTIAECHRRVLHNLGVQRGLEFLERVYDGTVNIVQVEPDDERKAREILERFRDQDISFTDATSLAVMVRLGVVKAFSFDWHFELLSGFLRIPPVENLFL